jgi:hypothetical protein
MRLLPVLCLVLLGACVSVKQEEATSGRPSANPGSEFALALGESMRIAGSRTIIHFSEVIDDSRCPMNARCIWEGNAKVAVEVLDRTVELNTSTRFATKQTVAGVTVELIRLEPSPMAGAQTTGYIATLIVGAAP